MSQALALNLGPTEAVTTAGTGSSVDLGEGSLRNVARLDTRLSAWAGGTVGVSWVKLTLQTSSDDTTWRDLESQAVSDFRVVEWGSVGIERYVRLSWSLATEVTSATFTARGFADVVYATPSDLVSYGLPEEAMEGVTTRWRIDACVAASDEADGYLAASYTLPLVAWSKDLSLHCGKMAVRYVLDRRGWDPESRDNVIETAFDRAIGWLKQVAKGLVRPPGIVDSAPEVFEAGSVVMSRPRRESSWL